MAPSIGRLAAGLVTLMVAGVVSVFGSPSAVGSECPWEPVPSSTLRAYESEMLGLLNNARAAQGAQAIAIDGRIAAIAREHAARMAEQHSHFHNQAYLSDPAAVGAKTVGEVVGRGACSPKAAHDSLMGSTAHRNTMLNAAYSTGGIGLASDEAGTLYYVEAFAEPWPAAPQPPPQPAPQAAPPAPASAAPAPATSTSPAPASPPVPAAEAKDTPPAPEPEPDHEVTVTAANFELWDQAPSTAAVGAVRSDPMLIAAALAALAAMLALAWSWGGIRRVRRGEMERAPR